ncbi:MAG: 50S ribosomal protein L4 [Thermodesulfobacteriota bacterium]|nr:50S ribosomal protein L4 [Thermodesulfobacteriota bacterium]
MVKIDIIDINRQKISEMEVGDHLLHEPEKPHLIYDVVRRQLACRRSGTASTKERSFVSGGGRKPWKQKGTGRARAGSNRSPLWRGGGTIFGPHPRDYSFHLPQKVRRAALRSAVSDKFREEKLLVLERWELEEAKTKRFLATLKTLGIHNALIVTDGRDEKLEKSARNVPRIQVIECEGLNVYDILRHEHLIFLRSSLERMERKLRP